MLIVDGSSKIVVFQLDHRLGGAFGCRAWRLGARQRGALAEKTRG